MRTAVVFLLLLCQPGWAESLQLNQDIQRQSLNHFIYYFEDPTQGLNLSDVIQLEEGKWQRNQKQTFNRSYSTSTWWLKISFRHQHKANLSRLLEISYPVLDYVNVYAVSNAGITEFNLGDKLPFDKRPIRHRSFVIPLEFQPLEKMDVFISVQSASAIQVPITLWSQEEFFYHHQTQNMIHGLYFGIMVVMAIYNLFIFLAIGERSYLYYVMFICCTPLFLSSLTGFSFQHLWPHATHWNDQAIIVSLSGVVFFGILFTWEFLKLSQQHILIKSIAQFFLFSSFLTAGLSFFITYNTGIRIIIPLATLACAYCLFMGYYRWNSGEISARYYAVAWSVFLLGGITLSLNKYTILPQNLFTEYATQIGSALEAILLSFALADRINKERMMRFSAQEEALLAERDLRHAREQSLEIQKQATETLELRVQERTKELERLNRKLEALSDTDQLTGLKNRRYLDRVLKEEFSRCTHYQHAIALLLLDIDHFKSFNDNYGHLVGDECLKAVALCVKKGLRWASDRSARYGGEEFCVLLPETSLKGALTVAERIRTRVEAMEFMVEGKVVPVTISVGATSIIPTTEQSLENLIAQADSALYASKENGRNRVTPFHDDSDYLIDQKA